MSTVLPFQRAPEKSKAAVAPRLKDSKRNFPQGITPVGIDLGTTNSVVSVYSTEGTHPQTLAFEGEALVPSMLYVDSENGSEVVGKRAREMNEFEPDLVIKSTKRSMGSERATFVSGERSYKPEDVASRVLRYLTHHSDLSADMEKFGKLHAVITVPAHFDDAARQATIAAANDANIEVLRIVNEPTAAALAYSMLPDVRDKSRELLAVFDFGGGTFDVSIVDRDGLIFNVLASEGDVKLGGDDIDFAIAEHLRESVEPKLVARRATERSALFGKLLYHAEQAKRTLLEQGDVRIVDDDLDGKGSRIDTVLTRETFEELASPFIARTLELTERALLAAKKRPSQLSRILLVGGSSRLSLVHSMLEAHFPNCFVDGRLEPDLAVSWGASAQAAIILGLEPETILVDVCSHSLGIGVAEDSRTVQQNFRKLAAKYGLSEFMSDAKIAEALGDKIDDFNRELLASLRVAPIIQRNSPLPARRSEFFSTLYENQFAVQVVVVQGEQLTVGENRLVGTFLFRLEQPCPMGTRCEIQLTYDVNGMIHVLAKQIDTGNIAEAEFDSRTGEVTGWNVLGVTGDQNPLDALSTQTVSESAAPTQDDDANEVPISNAMLVRARRGLMRCRANAELSRQLHELTQRYENVLRLAQKGVSNDDELDSLESKLDEILTTLSV